MTNTADPPGGPVPKKRKRGGALSVVPLRPGEVETRPDVHITTKVHEVTEAMVSVLRSDPDLYQRGHELVHVIRCADEDDGFPAGSPIIRIVPAHWLVDRVSMYGKCILYRDGQWIPCPPPKDRVNAVLARGEWPGIRHIEAVVEAPTMRPDGTILQTPGFDRATRVLYAPNDTFPPIPEAPTHSDAVIAYAHLADVFRDFPYVHSSHLSAVVAAALTLIGRPAIAGSIPCWLFDANSPRSGKSLQMDVLSIIATGRKASRATYPEKDEELEKVIGAYADSGARIVPFDNIARPFGGATLDKVITATDMVDLRVLGVTLIKTLPWRALIMGSGNNVACRGDMLPRVLAPRLESPLENPETRDLRDLRSYALEHRVRLVADALTILRAYVVAGRPPQDVPKWGGFDQWVALIANALVWVGAPDPTGARRGLADDEDPLRAAEATIVAGWRRLCGDRPSVTVSGAIATLYPGRTDHEAPPDGLDDLREAVEHVTKSKSGYAPSSRTFGDALRKIKSRVISGQKLVTDGKTGKVARWLTIDVR